MVIQVGTLGPAMLKTGTWLLKLSADSGCGHFWALGYANTGRKQTSEFFSSSEAKTHSHFSKFSSEAKSSHFQKPNLTWEKSNSSSDSTRFWAFLKTRTRTKFISDFRKNSKLFENLKTSYFFNSNSLSNYLRFSKKLATFRKLKNKLFF